MLVFYLRQTAALKLKSMLVDIDIPSTEQCRYLASWGKGT